MRRILGISDRWLLFSAMLVSALLFLSCEHRPLEEIGNTHYVRVYIDEEIPNVTKGIYNPEYENPVLEFPSVMRAVLYDKNTGAMVAERYLQESGRDGRGYYLDGYIMAPPGDYRFMAYNFGTETTQLWNENDYLQSEAYTGEISKMLYGRFPRSYDELQGMKIVYDPDHLWVAAEESVRIVMHEGSFIDTLHTAGGDCFTAETIVKSYYVQIKVLGIQYISSASVTLSGMAGSKWLCNRNMNEDNPVCLYFEMKSGPHTKVMVNGDENGEKTGNDGSGESGETATEIATIYATFNTFGKLPDKESELVITFEFIKTDGTTQVASFTITPVFYTEDGMERQWLLLDKYFDSITITPPDIGSGGGFAPGVDDWEDENADVVI